MSSLERATTQKRAKKQAIKPAKPAATVDAKSADDDNDNDEAAYQEELKREAEEEKAELKAKELKAMNGAGAAIKEDAEKISQKTSKLGADTTQVVVDAKVVIEKAPELVTSHPDMCDPNIFGTYDPNNKSCTKDCAEFSPECAAACKALMESRLVKGKTPKATKPRKEGATHRSANKVLTAGAESASGRCETLLCRPEGASKEELMVIRPSYSTHLSYLKKEGFTIVLEAGRYFYRKPVVATA